MALTNSWTMPAPGLVRAEVLNRMTDLRRVAATLPFAAVDDLRSQADEIEAVARLLDLVVRMRR